MHDVAHMLAEGGFLHLIVDAERHLGEIVRRYETWAYAIFALIIFAEVGLVVFPFLPGDSMLFFLGALAARGSLNPWVLFGVLALAAIAGDSCSYGLGKLFRRHVAEGKRIHLVRREWLEATHAFYGKHGPKAVVLARFVPIVRSLAPFCAGLASMEYRVFVRYSVIGAAVWVGGFVAMGFWLGRIPIVERNFPLVAAVVVALTVTFLVVEIVRALRRPSKAP